MKGFPALGGLADAGKHALSPAVPPPRPVSWILCPPRACVSALNGETARPVDPGGAEQRLNPFAA